MMLQEVHLDSGFHRSRSPSSSKVASTNYSRYKTTSTAYGEEIERLSEEKRKQVEQLGLMPDQNWKEVLRDELNQEIDERVREALDTPPLERVRRNSEKAKRRTSTDRINQHITLDLTEKEQEYMRLKQWKEIRKRRMKKVMSEPVIRTSKLNIDEELRKLENPESVFPGVCGLNNTAGLKMAQRLRNFGCLSQKQKLNYYFYFTKEGLELAMKNGRFPDGSPLTMLPNGKYVDQYGVIRNEHGPFWPEDYGPMFQAPYHRRCIPTQQELLWFELPTPKKTYDNQLTPFPGNWRGIQIVYDSERSAKDYKANPVSEGLCPSLTFESRFESGNLRQARRVGHYEYELVLKTDLYTKRHTQWFYFRIKNMVPGVVYKFRIVNLLKKDSLYNHGMRPLLYSEKNADLKHLGWVRTGFNISYTRNDKHLQCPLLPRDIWYYKLEWEMEFPHNEDTCYMAHCYPYTFTDLRDDIEELTNDPTKQSFLQREVLCESRAGNSCFLLTVTNFANEDTVKKKAIIATARVHPGESNASWMMKGLIDFITGDSHTAKILRDKYVFKIVPMLNPDGVIVGNYRCSLVARDLNRNYRHPRKESFPTVWHTKAMMDEVQQRHEILLYCDLHGHSRKSNVFMYGCNPNSSSTSIREFINERLFPYLMSQKAPDKFSFNGCKFLIRRCKEATGRVVMWRQMRVMNSFTMEATFSGTNICLNGPRHFNQRDFQDMGRSFCEVILDYDEMETNRAKQSEIILGMTRTLTHQLLQNKGIIPTDQQQLVATQAPAQQSETSIEAKQSQGVESDHIVSEQIPTMTIDNDLLMEAIGDSPAESLSAAVIAMLKNGTSPATATDKSPAPHIQNTHGNTPPIQTATTVTKSSVDDLIDSLSVKTIDGCMDLLSQLKMTEITQESSSSDSDSESDPEMKAHHESKKKKKKKSKKHKDKDKSLRRCNKILTDDRERSRSVSALPAIAGAKMHSAKAEKEHIHVHSGLPMEGLIRMPTGFKTAPKYVSKYQGRSNGGIPCFSEERSLERAAQRMQEMRKRMEDRHREEAVYYVRDRHSYLKYAEANYKRLLTMTQMQREKTSDEIRKSFQTLLSEFSSPKLGYTHSDDLDSPMMLPPSTGLEGLFDDQLELSSELDTDRPSSSLPLTVRSEMTNMQILADFEHQPVGTSDKPPLYPIRSPDTHNRFTGRPLHKSKAKYMKSMLGSSGRKAVSADSELHSMTEEQNEMSLKNGAISNGFNVNQNKMSDLGHYRPKNSPNLLSRDYTDVLIEKLKQKRNSSSGLVVEAPSWPGIARHSTCE